MSRLRKVGLFGTVVTSLGLAAVALVSGEEGLRLKTYKDTVGRNTYCHGETKNAQWGKTYTKEYCDALLISRLDDFSEKVDACITQVASDKTRLSFYSFAYNIGSYGFCHSTTARLYNSGKKPEACRSMMMWTKQKELVGRRTREMNLCLEGLK